MSCSAQNCRRKFYRAATVRERSANRPRNVNATERRAIARTALLYGAALLVLVNLRPLWLDEVIQLSGTCGTTSRGVLRHVIDNAGGAPFAYLAQHWWMSVAGCGVLAARFPSALAGAASLAAFVLLGKKLGVRGMPLAAALWIACPLLLRYSLEARPYMQATLLALLAVLAQIKLRDTGRVAWAAVLAACLAAGVYSQPFAPFAPLGFALWSAWRQRDPKYSILTCAAWVAAGLSFVPWILAAQTHWTQAIARSRAGFDWKPSLALVIVKEFAGDGYLASVPLFLLALYSLGVALRKARGDARMGLLAAAFSGVALALLADAWFNYFFAIRQVMFGAPFLLLLAADGAAALWERRRVPALLLVLVFAGASVDKNYRYLGDRNENWDRLSAALAGAADSGCILFPAGDSAALYEVFRPGIGRRLCGSALAARVIVPIHSYTAPESARAAAQALSTRGFTQSSAERLGFARLDIFERRGAEPRP